MTPTLTNEISGICSSAAGDSEPSMFLQATLESYKIAIYDLEISSGGCLRVSRQRYGIQDDTFGFAWSPEADLDIQISDYNGTWIRELEFCGFEHDVWFLYDPTMSEDHQVHPYTLYVIPSSKKFAGFTRNAHRRLLICMLVSAPYDAFPIGADRGHKSGAF
jgi:hypothetical protein